jgi:hypothetical protein
MPWILLRAVVRDYSYRVYFHTPQLLLSFFRQSKFDLLITHIAHQRVLPKGHQSDTKQAIISSVVTYLSELKAKNRQV